MPAPTPSLTFAGAGGAAATGDRPVGARVPSPRPGALTLVALLIAILYAAFAHGATAPGDEARLQLGLATLVCAVAATWLWHGGLRLRAPRAAWLGLLLLAGFAVWSGLSLAWSVDPDATWVELNRAIAYVLVVVAAIAAGSWDGRAPERLALGYLGIALLVAIYALGGKLLPGFHIGGLIDFNQTENFSRLRAPLQYWNALGLFAVLAIPIALRLAVDEEVEDRLRLIGLVSLFVLLLTLGLTYSRGGVVAAIVAVGLTMWLTEGQRLRTLLYLALALAAVAIPLAYGFTADDLTTNGVKLAERQDDGFVLLALTVAAGALLVIAGSRVLRIEARTPGNPERSVRIATALVRAVVALAIVGVGAMTFSDRGVTGTISHEWKSFRTPKTENQFDPARLLSTNSGNRWVWWEEAVGAWSDRPLRGGGAGSFPVLHREYRENKLDVLQPHNVPLQFLAETGLVGFLLAYGGLLLLVGAGLARVRRFEDPTVRGMAAALAAGSVAWLLHGVYDWDWDIPATTVPALAFLGVLAARPPLAERGRRPPDDLGGRVIALVGVTGLLAVFAVSAVLPWWADTKTQDAIATIGDKPTAATLEDAAGKAELASRLDPLSVEPLLAASIVAERAGKVTRAREYLLQAAARQPTSTRVWGELARIELLRGDSQGIEIAARRTLELDPHNQLAFQLVQGAIALRSPANGSATATGTPLVTITKRPPFRQLPPNVAGPQVPLAIAGPPAT
jgi:hypothetical protein